MYADIIAHKEGKPYYEARHGSSDLSSYSEQLFAVLICELNVTQSSGNAVDFHDRLGIGCKLTIQVLEFFGRSGFIRCKGNQHLLHGAMGCLASGCLLVLSRGAFNLIC